MHKFFYGKLALTNLRKNGKTYVPYMLTCIGTIIMFYNMCALTFHASTGDGTVASMMGIGTVVIGFFSVLFLFYTNGFLMKRRKKEIGLFNILGMEKKHIGKIMLWESIFIGGGSIILGLLFGIALSKLITLLLYKILNFNPNYNFEISVTAIGITFILFLGIFLMTLLSNLSQVHLANPIELLYGGNLGEKQPKTKWLITIIGILTMGTGYAIALFIQNPVTVLSYFFLAVILVIIGTYCLFISGSITFLKLLRKNKNYYYQTKHFTGISGMIYRMKQNAAGLASICILSTAVLVLVSTTVSMFIGMGDSLDNRYPTDVTIEMSYTPSSPVNNQKVQAFVKDSVAGSGRSMENVHQYEYLSFPVARDGAHFITDKNEINRISDNMLILLTADEYEKLSNQRVHLSQNQIAIYSSGEPLQGQLSLFGKEYRIKAQLDEFPVEKNRIAWKVDFYYMVVSDADVLHGIYQKQLGEFQELASPLIYDMSFNLDGTDEEKIACVERLKSGIREMEDVSSYESYGIYSKQVSKGNFLIMYGGLFFLGTFLGMLFLMATVLIIYYKQVVEGFEDKERYQIMKKVGMSVSEVKASIRSQVLTVFALPLVVAGIHIVAAFPILTKLLALLNLTNVKLFIICTICTVLIFALVYALVYAFTARVYNRIVNG